MTLPFRPDLVPFQSGVRQFELGLDTPRAFLERCLSQLALTEPHLKAFSALAIPRARIAADAATARWEAGRPLSAIDGMPVCIKDIIETFDMPTGMGSPAFEGWKSGRDAAAVFSLREAGAVIIGKSTTAELAGTYPCDTRNPHDLQRTSGGSSSGSASAVGAGVVPIALGTQVSGSIIRPSSFCGAFGYKPTVGAINRGGSHDYQSHSCLGIIGASLEDIWITANVIVEKAGGDPGAIGLIGDLCLGEPVKPKKVVFYETPGWSLATSDARAALIATIEELQRNGVQVISRQNDKAVSEFESATKAIGQLGRDIIEYESRWPANTMRARDPTGLSSHIHARLERSESMTLADYRNRINHRADLRQLFEQLAHGVDAFITLGAPGAAPMGTLSTGNPVFNVPASVLGAPALSLPILQDEGMPLGIQLLGAQHSDRQLFNVGRWLLGTLKGWPVSP